MRVLFCLLLVALLIACSEEEAAAPVGKAPAEAEPARNKTETAAAAPSGKAVFDHWCRPCHDAGPGHPGTMALAARYGEERSVILAREDLQADYVKYVVRNGFNMMPPLRPTEVTDKELEALAEYVASSPKAD